MSVWKLSAGTAGVIGRIKVKNEAPPTTAYLMLGERCRNNCRFCSQARGSQAKSGLLSRVTWPEVPSGEAVDGIAAAHAAGSLKRACLQVVDGEAAWQTTVEAVGQIKAGSAIPVCVSSHIASVGQARELIAAGAERICIALDAATPGIYAEVKEGDWAAKRQLLSECARALPGRVTTHLIVGLGESEAEMVEAMAACIADGITVGLFAFTPVRGTAWADRPQPALDQYRRIQVAHYLLKNKFDRQLIQFAGSRISGFTLPDLGAVLADGQAFQTSGCPDCNRPYYNERPGGVMYNYPRPLTAVEAAQALDECRLTEGGGR
ncbi:MAG: radical SAM protein [Negativicutes bacterium]|nr:radical SAM protein [Negativicutes bacterium]